MPQLEVRVAGERRIVDLDDRTVIGRSSGVDLVLELDAVSRRHAEVHRSDAGFVVTDLGSRNGTLVNGRRIAAPTILRAGDVIRISSAELVFHESTSVMNLAVTMVDTAAAPEARVTAIDASLAASGAGKLRPEDALRAVRRVTGLLTKNLELGDLLGQVLDAVFEFCSLAESAVVMLLDEAGELTPIASKARGGASGSIAISRTVLMRVVERKQAVASTNAAVDSRFELSQSLIARPIHSLMCVPLLNQFDEVLGVIEVHSERSQAGFPVETLDLMLSIANTAAIAVENSRLHSRLLRQDRIERDLEHAREVQRSFLPPGVPVVPGYRFFAHYEGAFTVSGDYYAFLALPDDRIAIGIADVSGKGMSAALMMARLSSDVRFALLQSQDPATVLAAVDDSLSESGVEGRFVSMVLMVLDWRRHRLHVANAGHPAPMLRRADGSVEPIRGGRVGLPLNITSDPELRPTTVSIDLEPGAMVLAYTDGISEARNEAQIEFGDERILESFRLATGDAEAVGSQLILAMDAFTAGARQRDDTTVVCFGPKA